MTHPELAIRLRKLQNEITQSDWYVSDRLYTLTIKSEREYIEDPNFKFRKPVKNVCMLASVGIKKTQQKLANAEFICLIQNNLPLIIEALNLAS